VLTHLRNSEAPHEEPDGANSVFEERAIGPTYCIAPKPQICRATIRSGSCPTRSTCVLGFAAQESRTMPPFHYMRCSTYSCRGQPSWKLR